jgi:hypothetical protein
MLPKTPRKFKSKTVRQSDILKTRALELKALGYGSIQAAEKLGIGRHRTRILYQEINEEWRERLLSSLLTDSVPLEWATSIELNRIIIRKAFELFDAASDMRVKTECLRLASDTSHRTGLLIGDSQKIGRSISKVLLLHPPTNDDNDDDDNTIQTDSSSSSSSQTALMHREVVSETPHPPQQQDREEEECRV